MIVFNYISQLVFNCFYCAINDILADLSSVFERTLFLITLIVVLLDFLLQVFDNYWNLPFKITQFYQIFCDNVPGFFPDIRQFHCHMSIVISRHDQTLRTDWNVTVLTWFSGMVLIFWCLWFRLHKSWCVWKNFMLQRFVSI